MDERVVAGVVFSSAMVALVGAQVALRRRRQRRDERALAHNVERGLHLPASLHPVIDADRCIGSLSCLNACPEGDILGIVNGAARLVHATHCVGHGRCAAACPVQAIKLVFGTATRGVDLPEVDQRFESSRPGVHVIGELAGMGLIRNAIEQATQCAEYLADELARRPSRDPASTDVAVIGAGPAGIACALGLRARGLKVRLLERERPGGAMAHYPRHGLVMNGPLQLPGVPKLRQERVTKPELLRYFERALEAAGQAIEGGVEVSGLAGQDGEFILDVAAAPGAAAGPGETGGPRRIAARKVVLATGRRGASRKLGVPGEDLPKVTYGLADAEHYAGRRVLVVGGGDAAAEAACALVEHGASVALSYRQPALVRCRPANRERIHELASGGRITLFLSSELREIEEGQVTLRSGTANVSLGNDYVIACLGGELPLAFLAKMGVAVRRLFGEERGALSGADKLPWTLSREQTARRRLATWMWAGGTAGLALLAVLIVIGIDYYPLRGARRLASPLHAALKPAGSLGVTIGIAASAVMLTNFLYALRKRWSALEGLGSLRAWLDVHVFVGVMSPVVIAFHAAFQSNNLMASGTYLSLGVVVATGLVGRWFYALTPGAQERNVDMAELLGQRRRLQARVGPMLAAAGDPPALRALLAEALAEPPPSAFAARLARSLLGAAAFRARLALALRRLPAGDRPAVRDALLRLRRVGAQVGLYGGIQRLMRAWRSLHVSLAVLLVVALTFHIVLSVYLGYGPAWR